MSKVGLVRIDSPMATLARAVALCNGFQGLRADSRVIIKPNVGAGTRRGSKHSPGLVTSAAMVEGLLQLLREFGCRGVTIGEGSMVQAELGLGTELALEQSGIAEVARKYDAALVDFNAGPFKRVDLLGAPIRVAARAFDADFFINMPVLKTHVATKVSLGLKNLKGCLDSTSRKRFHTDLDLEKSIALLATKIPVHLTVIDGTYGLQRGPLGHDYHEMNLVVAGPDSLSADIVGCRVLGIDPRSVVHLSAYAQLTGRTSDPDGVEVLGAAVEQVAKKLEWHTDWLTGFLGKYAVEGMIIQTPGKSFCSGCFWTTVLAIERLLRENRGAKFDAVEVCLGKEPIAMDSSRHVFLLGKCPMSTNRERTDAIRVRGCPPTTEDAYEALKKHVRRIS